jgi:hypothetical protein
MQHPQGTLLRQQRGSVQVEYVVVLSMVALTVAVATASLGIPLYRLFLMQQAWLLLPLP